MQNFLTQKLNFAKSVMILWLALAIFTQGFAAGLSCVHHLQKSSSSSTFVSEKFNPHESTQQSQIFNHYHHSLSHTSYTENSHQSFAGSTHCEMHSMASGQTGSQLSSPHSDCKCTYFISVDLIQSPDVLSIESTSHRTASVIIEAYISNDLTSIFRPPLKA